MRFQHTASQNRTAGKSAHLKNWSKPKRICGTDIILRDRLCIANQPTAQDGLLKIRILCSVAQALFYVWFVLCGFWPRCFGCFLVTSPLSRTIWSSGHWSAVVWCKLLACPENPNSFYSGLWWIVWIRSSLSSSISTVRRNEFYDYSAFYLEDDSFCL